MKLLAHLSSLRGFRKGDSIVFRLVKDRLTVVELT